jgi:hypothetical protein
MKPTINKCRIVRKGKGGLVRASHEEGRFKYLLVVLLPANHTRYF